MKKVTSVFLCLVILFTSFALNVSATDEIEAVPVVLEFNLTTESDLNTDGGTNDTRASGLITSYGLSLSNNGTTLNISGRTNCAVDVVKCGFKNLVVQRRASSSDSWEEYYDYGNVYIEAASANLSTKLVVVSGYQYRLSCKHYAKKSLLSTQTISNTSSVVTVS